MQSRSAVNKFKGSDCLAQSSKNYKNAPMDSTTVVTIGAFLYLNFS